MAFRRCLLRNSTRRSVNLAFNYSEASTSRRGFSNIKAIPKRTHTCEELTSKNVGEEVTLTGWLQPGRKVSKKMSFYPLRDAYGTTQIIAKATSPESGDILSKMAETPVESVVLVKGKVQARLPSAVVESQSTGEIEVAVEAFGVINPAADVLPFYPHDKFNLANEELRARYRYLDLRRPDLSENIRKRSRVTHIVRDLLVEEQGFTEVETPLLLRSTPEGAREYLVPTRLSTNPPSQSSNPPSPQTPHFYALSQSPQQPKQLLICSGGIDKYFQFARCFRDEDGRKDRQPEFTQIDMEMAFVSWNSGREGWKIGGGEVRDVVEGLIRRVWEKVLGRVLLEGFDVMTYREAMTRYGSDKPDTRFGLKIQQIDFSNSDVLDYIIIPASDASPKTVAFRSASETFRLDDPTALKVVGTGANSYDGLRERFPELKDIALPELRDGDVMFASQRPRFVNEGWTRMGKLRAALAEEAQDKHGLVLTGDNFLWITEFPLFTKDSDKEFMAHGRWSSSHHPFTAPMLEDLPLLEQGKFEEVRGQHYDLVLNGTEIAGGSVRIHDAKLQESIFRDVLQLTENEVQSFEHLLSALKSGAPPHGGIAIGFDRLMSIICGTKSIRDVIAFPKTAGGTDPLFKSPSAVGDEVLKAYGLRST